MSRDHLRQPSYRYKGVSRQYMWVTPSCLQLFGRKYTPFLASLFHSAARRHGRRCARAGRGKPDIDVVVQLQWVNPKTTKQHLILQNSSVVSKKKHQKMLRMLTQPRDSGVEWSPTVQPLGNRVVIG